MSTIIGSSTGTDEDVAVQWRRGAERPWHGGERSFAALVGFAGTRR